LNIGYKNTEIWETKLLQGKIILHTNYSLFIVNCSLFCIFVVQFLKMTIKKIILILAFGVIATSSFAQTNFFAADDDAQTKDFYKRSMRYTSTVLGNFSKGKIDVGAAFLLHSPNDRISFYFDAKINAKRYYNIAGIEIDNVERTEMPILQKKEVSYQSLLVNVGMARAVTRNFILYAAVGVCAQNTDFKNKATPYYTDNYNIPRQGIQHNLGIGALYVTDKKFTFQLGMDLFDLSINTGIGYTW